MASRANRNVNATEISEQLRDYILSDVLSSTDMGHLGAEDDLLAGGIIDSMSAARLASHMEERFEIDISPTDFTFENFNTLNALAELVLRKLRQ